jgi:hypothetical protein
MDLDALIHRKFPPITRQYDAKDAVDLQSGAARPSLRASRFVGLKSAKSSPQEKRHH